MEKINKIEIGKLYYQFWSNEITLQNDGNCIIKKYEPFMILDYQDVNLDHLSHIPKNKEYQKIHILTSQGLKTWFFIDKSRFHELIHEFTIESPNALGIPSK